MGVEADQEDPETDEEEYAPQVFPEHPAAETRYTRSLYYGALPATDRPSLPLTRLAVDQFTSSGLDALGQKLGRLDMARVADISRQACAGPNSLVLALLYLERLRRRNPDYLTTVSSANLFLVSLMVTSKFLHDDGEEDEVFNDEWASSGGIDTKELNRLEVKFLAAMDWRIFVDDAEFQTTLCRLEADIAIREVTARDGDATYSDLTVLGSGEQAAHMLSLLAQAAIKVTAVCLTTYAAGILTGSKDSKDSSTLLKTLDEERGEVPTLRPRLLSQSDISSDSDSGQGGKPLIEKEEKGHRLVAMPRKGRSAKARGAGKKAIKKMGQAAYLADNV